MSDDKTHAFVKRDFHDSGSEEQFTKRDVVPLEEGRFLNFKAAGLVRLATDEEIKAAADAATAAEQPATEDTRPATKATGKATS